MFLDYERLVMQDYDRKKHQHKLPAGLAHFTQARLKRECIRLLSEGKVHGKDERAIRDFCVRWDETKSCLQNMQKCDGNRFKALSNFLQGRAKKTEERNIELLAWLIDFPHRPFVHGRDYMALGETLEEGGMNEGKGDDVIDSPPELGTDCPIEDEGGTQGGKHEGAGSPGEADAGKDTSLAVIVRGKPWSRINKGRTWRRSALVVMILMLAVGCGGYWWWKGDGAAGSPERTNGSSMETGRLPKSGAGLPKDETKVPANEGGCMYWADDHYQPIRCDQKIPHVLIVALDPDKVKNFKKITRPDTITNRALGHVWISIINNRIEFFTADGDHPVNISRHLRPLSMHMIETYIHPGMIVN